MITDKTIYVKDLDTGVQIDAVQLEVSQGEVLSALDTLDETHTNVAVLTPRDFVYIPDLDINLTVGDEIYLDNQSTQKWTVRQGWYEVDGNPAIYGWYLESVPVGRIRSLYLKDVNNLTMASTSNAMGIKALSD